MLDFLNLCGLVAVGAAARPPLARRQPPPVVVDVVKAVDPYSDPDAYARAVAALPAAPPSTPGAKWRDEKGRVRVVSREPRSRACINEHRALVEFLKWLREHEFVGFFASDDVVEFYQFFCAEAGYSEMPHASLLAALKAAPGVTFDRIRLADPGRIADPSIRRLRRWMKQTRASLYRIASLDELAGDEELAKAA